MNNPTARPDFKVERGRLYKHVLHSLNFKETPEEDQWKICIPEPLRKGVLQKAHDAPTAGHLGIAKTIARMAEHYYWPGMFREVAKYVKACRNCQQHKATQHRPAGQMHATNVTRPWEQVTVDLVGPLPRSRRSHTWLLSMLDRFSKWAEFVPLRKATADAVTQALTNHIILKHICPESVLTDNETQLRSRQLEERLAESGIRHVTTPTYAPRCNPVERTNRTIKTMINTWTEIIALGTSTFPSCNSRTTRPYTGYTPAYLNHGRELAAPTDTEG